MPSIRQRLAELLLGDEKKKINDSMRVLYEAYQQGQYEVTPMELVNRLREVAPWTIDDLLLQVQYEVIGGVGQSGLTIDNERVFALNESRRLWKHDPMAQWTIWLWTFFGFGEDIHAIPEDEEAVEVWNEFWEADRNIYVLAPDRFHYLSHKVLVDGEFFMVYYVNTLNGLVTVRVIDTDQITEIVTHPDDNSVPVAYKRQWQDKNETKELYYRDFVSVISEENRISRADLSIKSAKFAEDVNPTTMVFVQHVAHNIKTGSRGWALLSTGSAWIKAHKRFREDRAAVASSVAMFVNQIKAKGAGTRGVDAIRQTLASQLSRNQVIDGNPPPAAGSTFIGNDASELTRMPLNTGGGDAKSDGEGMLLMAGIGGGVYPHWMGAGDSYRLATACYSEDTEVLTESGWKYWHEWQIGEKIATYKHEGKKIEYMRPTKLHVYEYNGKMVHIKGRGVNALVTPNHRMLILNENNMSKEWAKKEYEVIEAENLPSRFALPARADVEYDDIETFILPKYVKLPSNKIENKIRYTREMAVSMNDWLEFLGYWISEGSLYKNKRSYNYQVELCQSKLSKDTCEKIDNLLSRLPFKFNKRYSEKRGMYRWGCSNKALYLWLCENCGKGAANKKLPDFAKRLSKRQGKILLDALWDGDGHWQISDHYIGVYYSTSKQLIDDMQIVMLHCGEWGGVKINREENTHPDFERSKTCWALYRGAYGKKSLGRKRNISYIDYAGVVWCFEAPPNKMFITRRKGQSLIAGNSSMEAPMYRQFSMYQKFWSAQIRDMARIVLWSSEKYSTSPMVFTTYNVDVSTDRLIETDLGNVSASIASIYREVIIPMMTNGLITTEVLLQVNQAILRIMLQALGVADATDITSDEAMGIGEEPEEKLVDTTEGIAALIRSLQLTDAKVDKEGKLIVHGQPLKTFTKANRDITIDDISAAVKAWDVQMPQEVFGLLGAAKQE